MGKTGKFVHRLTNAINIVFDSSYGSDKYIKINLNKVDDGGSSALKYKPVFSGNIQLVRLKGTVSGAESIILKGYEDQAGTKLLLPPSQSSLEDAIAGSTLSATFKVDIFHASANDELYIFAKTNAGTFTVTEVQVTWFE